MFSELESIINLANNIGNKDKTTTIICVVVIILFLVWKIIKLIFKRINKEDDLNFNLTLEPSEQKKSKQLFFRVKKKYKV